MGAKNREPEITPEMIEAAAKVLSDSGYLTNPLLDAGDSGLHLLVRSQLRAALQEM